jgi:adenylate kinase family enzyme
MKKSNVKKFVIDGFPRALDQSDAFESSVCPSTAMLFLDCPEHVMEVRHSDCASHAHGPDCSTACCWRVVLDLQCPEMPLITPQSTSLLNMPITPQLLQERLLGRTEGRADDNPETVKKRFKVYQEQTMPVIERYERNGKLRRVVADRTPDEVFADVSAIIEAIQGAPPLLP